MTPAKLRALVAKLHRKSGDWKNPEQPLLDTAADAIAALLDQLAVAKRDAARLSWLADNPRDASIRIGTDFKPCTFWGISSAGNDLRAAIDAAIAAQGEK